MRMTDLSPTSFVASGFEPVADTFLENFSNGLDLGAGFAAFLEGECVIDIQAGFTDRKSTEPWTDKTLVPVYSVSKGISALVIAYLVEQGRIDYAKPLADYWPEFAAHGKSSSAWLKPCRIKRVCRDLWSQLIRSFGSLRARFQRGWQRNLRNGPPAQGRATIRLAGDILPESSSHVCQSGALEHSCATKFARPSASISISACQP